MTREERAAQLWAILVLAAQDRRVLSYDMVARACGVPRAAVGGFLAPIQDYCQQRGLQPLTVLVVSEESGLPGEGFIAAADIPEAQARVFKEAWLDRAAATPAELGAALMAS
jgi:hypothetical protein